MRLSTKGRYGLKAIYDLALNYGKGPVPLAQISERQDVSLSYLEQLFAALRRAKLVTSIRGAHGGYQLTKPPHEITVGDVLTVLEGSLAPVSCTSHEEDHCTKSGECVTKSIWEKIHTSINSVVDNISLQDMVDDARGIRPLQMKKRGES